MRVRHQLCVSRHPAARSTRMDARVLEHPQRLLLGNNDDLVDLFFCVDSCNKIGYHGSSSDGLSFTYREEKVTCRNISTFDASGTSFSNRVIKYLWYFPQISTLNLSFNSLEDKFEGLSALVNMRVLDLSHNQLTGIGGIDELRNLEVLRLNDNLIEDLDSISTLSSLKELWVSNNKIKLGSLVYCLGCKDLQIVVKYGNSFDKDKMHLVDSILNLLPNIQFIDNSRVTSSNSMSTLNQVAITRIRSLLNPKQKMFFSKNMLCMTGSEGDSPSDSPSPSPRGIHPRDADPPRQMQAGFANNIGGGDNSYISSISTASAEGLDVPMAGVSGAGKRSAYQKAQKVKRLPVVSYKARRTSDVVTVLSPRHQLEFADTGAYSDAVEVPPLASSPKKQTRERKVGSMLQPLASTSTPTPTTIVYFGNRSKTEGAGNCPIALCINNDDSGYCKYEKKGVVAASFEDERLFAFYRNGSIAANLDSSSGRCRGSVQDSKGHCVLTITEGICTAFDSRGNQLGKYLRQIPVTGDDDLSDHVLKWSFDGLRISFNTYSWELLIKVQNEKVNCLFSSISPHVRLLEELDYSPAAVAAASRKKQQQQNASLKEFSFDDHKSVRSELSTMILSLDGMMTKYRSESNK